MPQQGLLILLFHGDAKPRWTKTDRINRRKEMAVEAVLEQLIEHGPGEIASVCARAFEWIDRLGIYGAKWLLSVLIVPESNVEFHSAGLSLLKGSRLHWPPDACRRLGHSSSLACTFFGLGRGIRSREIQQVV